MVLLLVDFLQELCRNPEENPNMSTASSYAKFLRDKKPEILGIYIKGELSYTVTP